MFTNIFNKLQELNIIGYIAHEKPLLSHCPSECVLQCP